MNKLILAIVTVTVLSGCASSPHSTPCAEFTDADEKKKCLRIRERLENQMMNQFRMGPHTNLTNNGT